MARGVWMAALLATAACSEQKFEKVPDAQVDPNEKAAAEKFGTTMLTAWAKDSYPTVGDEATADMKTGNSPDAQKAADKQIEQALGDFQSMSFAEADRSVPPKAVVYRFKGTFSKSPAPVEVRVVMDSSSKVAGFWVKPWKDALQ